MKQVTRYLPGFHLLAGRARKSSMEKHLEAVEQIKRRRPGELHSCFGDLINESLLRGGQRRRGFDAPTTFWAFLGQTMRDGSCRDGLLEVQASRERAGLPALSSSTSSYCVARRERLFEEDLRSIHGDVSQRLRDRCQWSWHDREVYAVDGTGVSIADTAANQEEYPQPGEQKPGCGFPVVQLVGLFHMGSGALCHYEESPMRVNESTLLNCTDMMGHLKASDVLVADRAYCSYINFAQASQKGIDMVARLHQARKKSLPGDRMEGLVQWKKPLFGSTPEHITKEEWSAWPEKITVRYIRIRPEGCNNSGIVLATSIMNLPAADIAGLLLRRWYMEVSLRDIKSTLGMDDLMVQSPDMARKTIAMFMIAHNLIRWTMLQAANTHHTDLQRISFKGTVDAIEHWKHKLFHSASLTEKRSKWNILLLLIASDTTPDRPSRNEPRCKKRRPKKFQLMTAPRHLMTISPSRRQK